MSPMRLSPIPGLLAVNEANAKELTRTATAMGWTARGRACRVAAALASIFLLGYVVHRGANRGSDFKYPYGAARLFWTTGRLRVDAQPRYPVTFHVMLSPLAALPLGRAVAIWAGLSFAATAALPGMLRRLSGVEPRRQVAAWLLVAPFFIDALVLGQSDPINLLLVTTALVVAGRGRGVIGSLLIGLAGSIKLLPLAHWATLMVRRPGAGVVAGMILSAALGLGLVASAAGGPQALDAIRTQAEWLRTQEKPWDLAERGGDLRPNNEGLPIVLARTFGALPDPARARPAVSLARLPLPFIWPVWWGVLALLGAGWAASIGPSRRVEPRRGDLAMLALGSIIMLAASPICWHHYFLWLTPGALFLAHRRRLLLASAAASLLITTWPVARGLGGHMMIALAFFAAVARDLRREADHHLYEPRAADNL